MDSFVNGRTARPPQAGQRKAASGYTVAFQHASMISARSCSRGRARKQPPNFTLTAALSLVVALFSACSLRPPPEQVAADGLAPEASAAGVQVLANAQGSQAVFSLVNHSKHPIGYWGYAPDTPQVWVERKPGSGWEETGWDWCGTGLEPQTLQPGASVSFQYSVCNDVRPLRLATHVYDLDAPTVLRKIWSNGVQPSE